MIYTNILSRLMISIAPRRAATKSRNPSRDLDRLSDQILQDIGLTRGDRPSPRDRNAAYQSTNQILKRI